MSTIFIVMVMSGSAVSFYAASKNKVRADTVLNSSAVGGMEFRSIGQAFTSGRIVDSYLPGPIP